MPGAKAPGIAFCQSESGRTATTGYASKGIKSRSKRRSEISRKEGWRYGLLRHTLHFRMLQDVHQPFLGQPHLPSETIIQDSVALPANRRL